MSARSRFARSGSFPAHLSVRAASAAGVTGRLTGVSGGCCHARRAVSLGDALGTHRAGLSRGARPACLAPAASVRALPHPRLPPTGPAAPFCSVSAVPLAWLPRAAPPAPPERSGSSHRRSGSPTSAAGPGEPASAAFAARALTLCAPRVAAADPSASAAWLARQRGSSGATEARRQSRDKRRRRTRRHSKRSMWCEIQLQALA